MIDRTYFSPDMSYANFVFESGNTLNVHVTDIMVLPDGRLACFFWVENGDWNGRLEEDYRMGPFRLFVEDGERPVATLMRIDPYSPYERQPILLIAPYATHA